MVSRTAIIPGNIWKSTFKVKAKRCSTRIKLASEALICKALKNEAIPSRQDGETVVTQTPKESCRRRRRSHAADAEGVMPQAIEAPGPVFERKLMRRKDHHPIGHLGKTYDPMIV